MSLYAPRNPIVGTPFSPTGRILSTTPALARWHSLTPSLQQLPKDSPLTKQLLAQDFSKLEERVLAHMS